MKTVLIVTYYWPPAGGGGVQRVAKFCRYLGDFGWAPVVLTVRGGNYPALDGSLLNDVKTLEHVYRAPSLEPHAVFRALSRTVCGTTGPRAANRSSARHGSTSKSMKTLGEWVRLNLFIPDSRIGWIGSATRTARRVVRRHIPMLSSHRRRPTAPIWSPNACNVASASRGSPISATRGLRITPTTPCRDWAS